MPCLNWRRASVGLLLAFAANWQMGTRSYAAGSVTLTSPTAGSQVSGVVNFTVDVSTLPSAASVEYSVGSLVLGVATSAPFGFSYQTGHLMDGDQILNVLVRDAYGSVIGSTQSALVVANRGNNVRFTSPDLNLPLSGSVTVAFTSTDTAYYPTFWYASLDGALAAYADTGSAAPQHTVSKTMVIDTTRVPNGVHELHLTMHSREINGSAMIGRDWRGMATRLVNINNGHIPMEVVPNYLHAYVAPGQQLALACKLAYTDLLTEPCVSPGYISDTPAVASVSSTGVVQGVAEGFAQVTVSASGKSAKVFVWVRSSQAVPHFSGNGQMLSQYTPGQSMFMVAPMELNPSEVRDNVPGLLAEIRRAGVNTIAQGIYPNPRSLTTTWEQWRSGFDYTYGGYFQYAASQGLKLMGTGDDIARGIGAEAWWTLNWPYGRQAVQYSMQKFAESGAAIGLDVVDEGSMIWGASPAPPGKIGSPSSFTSIECASSLCTVQWPGNPVTASRQPFGARFVLRGSANGALNTPAGQMFTATAITSSSFQFVPVVPVTGSFTASNDSNLEFLWWGGEAGGCPSPCNPPVANNAVATISQWLKTAPARVPISWPALGVHPAVIHGNWYGKSAVSLGISDYASHYWDSLRGRETYPFGMGAEEVAASMRQLFYERQNLMNLSRPQSILAGLMGPNYRKNSAGNSFNPPQDEILHPGILPRAVVTEMFTGAAIGATGLRLYTYDASWAKSSRSTAGLGAELQTGADPFQSTVENWRAMGYSANLLTKVLQPYLLDRTLSSPSYGRGIITAARLGLDAKMLMLVNSNDGPRTVSVDFAPYQSTSSATRYRVNAGSLATAVVRNATGETLTLAPGESVAYLFPLASATVFTEPVPFTPPSTAYAKAVLRHNYVYAQDLAARQEGVDCLPACTLDLDRRLGDVHYQYTYLDGSGAVIGQSAVLKLSPFDPIGSSSDRIAPSVPAGLQATAVSSTQVNLVWTASTDNVGVAGYRVYRNGAQVAVVPGTTYSVTGLTAATGYTFTVAAYDAAGNTSLPSSTASATTEPAADTVAPSVPVGLQATAASSTQVNLLWTASTDNIGVTGYRIYRNGTLLTSVSGTSYANTGLAAGTSYTYTVAAFDAAGNVSAPGAPVTCSTPAGADATAPTVPGGLSARTISSSQISLSWTISTDNVGVAGYLVYRNGVAITRSTTNAFADSGLSPSTSFSYTVLAYDAAGNQSAHSATVVAATLAATTDTTPPSVPGGLTARAVSNSQVSLSWAAATDNVGVAGYMVYRNGVALTRSVTAAYADSGLTPATRYTYSVLGYDAAGNQSAQSASVSVTTLAATDTTAPSVTITSPTRQATLSGTVTIAATARDNVGVVGVTFAVDGVAVGPEDTSAPYSISWNAASVRTGSHSITATARDAAGNQTRAAVTVKTR